MLQRLRILLIQIGSNGDCLFITTIARQIKELDFPNSHLTWMIGSLYAPVLLNNPYIDEVIQLPVKDSADVVKERNSVDITRFKSKYDHVFVTDYTPINIKNWYGTTRSSLFRNYPFQIKIPVEPQLFLSEGELSNVGSFAQRQGLTEKGFNILFECAPQSGQSTVTTDFAIRIAERVCREFPHVKVILSSRNAIESSNDRIVDGSVLTWRENAELTKFCHLLVGCSSGITWLNTSNASAKIDTLQVINSNYFKGRITASLRADFLFFGISTRGVIELTDPDEDLVWAVLHGIVRDGFSASRHQQNFWLNNYGGFSFLRQAVLNVIRGRHSVSNAMLVLSLLPSNLSSFLKNLYKKARRQVSKILR